MSTTKDLPVCSYHNNMTCAVFRERLQENFIKNVMQEFSDDGSCYMLSLVAPDDILGLDDPPSINVRQNSKKWSRRLRNHLPADVLFAGAIDISFNLFDNKPLCWLPHNHGIISRELTRQERRGLRDALARSHDDSVPRPVLQKRVKAGELEKAARYCCKSYFLRRSSFLVSPNTGRAPYRTSRDQRLKPKEAAILAEALKGQRASDMLVLRGFKRKRSSDPLKVMFIHTEAKR